MTAANAAPTYTPVYWTATDVLPAPNGVFGLNIQTTSSNEVQREEALAFLTFLKTDPKDTGTLALTTKPIPLLIKVPGTCKVKFILGLAPCFSDPFAGQPSPIHGSLLAIDGDIDDVLESPTVRKLPDTLLNMRKVLCPSNKKFLTKMEEHIQNGSDAEWFKARGLPTADREEVDLAMVAPFPPYLAYDALTTEVEAHVLFDRVETSSLKTEAAPLEEYVKQFLRGVHTKHTGASLPLDLGTGLFLERQHPDAKKWARDRAQKLFGHGQTQIQGNHGRGQGLSSNPTDIALLAQALVAAKQTAPVPVTPDRTTEDDTDPDTFKTYGLCRYDLNRFLHMCGYKEGQEDLLPDWIPLIATKNMSTDGKRAVVRKLLQENLRFPEHPIPLHPTIMKMLIAKEFTGDDDSSTAGSAMKGLSPYTVVYISAEELEEARNFHDALEEATTATVAEVRKKHSRTARAPTSFQDLLDTLKTFANLLQAAFKPRCPLLLNLLRDVINPLLKLTPVARQLMKRTTLAAILWAVYKESTSFALGKEDAPATPEWETAVGMIRCKSDFTMLEVPVAINGISVITSKKRKETDTNGGGAGAQPQPDDQNESKKGGQPPPTKKAKMEIHPVIKAKLTPALPPNFHLKALLQCCDIKDVAHVFPDLKKVCLLAALQGSCPFKRCVMNHNSRSQITDEMAEAAVAMFQPYLQDPSIYKHPGK